jgi:hypothetical protein
MMNFKSLAFLIFGFFIIGCSKGLFENSKKKIKGKAEILRFEDQNLKDSTIVEGYVVSRRENFSLDHVSVYTRQPLVGKLTDENGHFRFKVAPGKYDIISQYIGYTTFTIPQLEVKKKERLIILIKMGTTIQPLH